MSTAVKFRAGKLLFELLPTGELPRKYSELLDIMTQVWQMLGSETLICETDNEKDERTKATMTHDL